MIRICHVITGLSTGGAEVSLARLIDSLDPEHFESMVISLSAPGEIGRQLLEKGFDVRDLGLKRGQISLKALLKLRRIIRAFNPDLIQGWMYHGNLAASLAAAARCPKIPVAWNIRNAGVELGSAGRLTEWIMRAGALLSPSVAAVIYNSKSGAQYHEAAGYASRKTRIIYNGFDCETFKPRPDRGRILRRELGIAGETAVVGLVARFHPMKDHRTFFTAARLAAAERPDMHFIAIGKGMEPGNPELGELTGPEGFRRRITLLGERRDTADLYSAFDIACCSSSTESFPNTVGEAMASGRFCVVTDAGDSADIVGPHGRIVPPRNPEAMARAFVEAASMGKRPRGEVGLAARERIRSLYPLQATSADYAALYRSIATDGTGTGTATPAPWAASR